MAFNFELRVTGLCSVVYKRSETNMKFVLVNARDQLNHVRHHAALLTQRRFTDSALPRKHDFGFDGFVNRYTDFPTEWDWVGFLLRGEDFNINPIDGLAFNPDVRALQDDCPDPAMDRESLYWIARMADASAGKMHKSGFRDGDARIVLARLLVAEGKIEVESFTSGEVQHVGKKVLRWKLEKGGASVGSERALAEVVKLTRTVNSTTVTFKSSLGSNSDIVLRPDPKKPGDPVVAWLINQPIEDIVLPASAPRTIGTIEEHFHHFYDLSTAGAGGAHIPKATNYCPDAPVIGVSNPRCPLAFFDDYET